MLRRKRSSEDKCGKKRVKFSLDIMPVYIYDEDSMRNMINDEDSTSKMINDEENTNCNSNAESTNHCIQVALRKPAYVNEELNRSFLKIRTMRMMNIIQNM